MKRKKLQLSSLGEDKKLQLPTLGEDKKLQLPTLGEDKKLQLPTLGEDKKLQLPTLGEREETVHAATCFMLRVRKAAAFQVKKRVRSGSADPPT